MEREAAKPRDGAEQELGAVMFEGVKNAWHEYIGDAPVDDLYQAKLCAFVTAWEMCGIM